MEITKKDQCLLEEMRQVVAASTLETVEFPWDEIAVVSPVLPDPGRLWRKARVARLIFWVRLKWNWQTIQATGTWSEVGWMLGQASQAGIALLRLYLVGALYRCHIVGVLDVKRACNVLASYCLVN